MSKITIAEIRRRLPVGTKFRGTFVGQNARFAPPHRLSTIREVTKQTASEMSSMILTEGKEIGLTWKGLTAEEINGSIILSDEYQGAFLQISEVSTTNEQSSTI